MLFSVSGQSGVCSRDSFYNVGCKIVSSTIPHTAHADEVYLRSKRPRPHDFTPHFNDNSFFYILNTKWFINNRVLLWCISGALLLDTVKARPMLAQHQQ